MSNRVMFLDLHVAPGVRVMFLGDERSFLSGVVGCSLSFFLLLYGTNSLTGPVLAMTSEVKIR